MSGAFYLRGVMTGIRQFCDSCVNGVQQCDC